MVTATALSLVVPWPTLVKCRAGGIMVQTIDHVQRDKHARNPGTPS